MEYYRGKPYTIVQGIEPGSWIWTVYLDENTVRSGASPRRAAATAPRRDDPGAGPIIAAFRRRMSILGDFDLAIRVRHYRHCRVPLRGPLVKLRRALCRGSIGLGRSLRRIVRFRINL